MPSDLPPRQPAAGRYAPSAMPSTAARALAFAAIILGGLCGGTIGYAFVALQCDGDCTLLTGTGMLAGAVGGAVGVAVVATLALRAMGEWRDAQQRQGGGTGLGDGAAGRTS